MDAGQSIGQSTDQWCRRNPERFVQHVMGIDGQVLAEAGDVAGAPIGQRKEHRTQADHGSPQPPPQPLPGPAIERCCQEDLTDGQSQHQGGSIVT